MAPGSFDYHVPKTVDEAIALLGKLGDTTKILAAPAACMSHHSPDRTGLPRPAEIVRIPEAMLDATWPW